MIMTIVIVVMIIAVMRVSTPVPLPARLIRARLGIERCLDLNNCGAKTDQHVAQHMVASQPHPIARDLYVGVAIAEVPGEARQRLRRSSRNVQQRLGLGDDPHDRAIFEDEAVAVAQHGGVRQVEQDTRAALAGQREAAALAVVGIEHDAVACRSGIPCAGPPDLGCAPHRLHSLRSPLNPFDRPAMDRPHEIGFYGLPAGMPAEKSLSAATRVERSGF
jgi:hypothetical protein